MKKFKNKINLDESITKRPISSFANDRCIKLIQPKINESKQLLAVRILKKVFLKKKVEIINKVPQIAPHFIQVKIFNKSSALSLFP